jgi:hypothetical protein
MLTAEALTQRDPLTDEATYILPIRKPGLEDLSELGEYLDGLVGRLEVIVVDGSPPEVYEANAAFWPSCTHIAPDPARRVANGKVWGVLTGLDRAACDKVIIADEDVRYEPESLSRVLRLLNDAEVVRPQNYFDPLPWHAVWDTGRTLLNRAFDADWPGTLAVRRRLLERTNGYDGNCLFENLELVRTVTAAGGREARPLDLFVRRQPCDFQHFLSQRVRQAYDEFARPWRLAVQLALLPGAALLMAFRPRLFPLALAAVIGAAEYGRRRDRGTTVFPFAASLAAPLWLAERSVCSWLAVLSRLRYGGVRYHGSVISAAATPASVLERRYQALRDRSEG